MLLVSIHDVTPAQAAAVSHLWQICADRGLTPALLVVPNWHGQWPLEQHPGFVDWLRARAADGAEIVLHGERHDEVGLPRGIRDYWRAWCRLTPYTSREAEFLTLDSVAAGLRLDRGLRYLSGLGLEPSGFVAPAWLARQDTYDAAAAAGFRFSEDESSVQLLPSRRRLPSPVVRWSARTSARAWGSVAVARVRSLVQRRTRLARIALHPLDVSHPATTRSLSLTLDRWLSWHRPGRYADLIPPTPQP